MSRNIPNKVITCNDKDAPWITTEIKTAIKRNAIVHRKWVLRGRIPEERGRIPEERGRIPEERGRIPEERGRIPEERGRIPEERGRIPYEIRNHDTPQYLHDRLPAPRKVTYKMRSSREFNPSAARTSQFTNSFCPCCISEWEELSDDVKSSLDQFKSKIDFIYTPS